MNERLAALLAERPINRQHAVLICRDLMREASLSFVGRESDPARGQMGLDMVYKTKDGYITAGAVSNAEWEGMCRAFDREDLLNDPRFNTVAARGKNGAERRSITSAEIEKWPSKEILKKLDACSVPCAPVLGRNDLLTDEQVRINELIEIHQDERYGPVRQPRPSARFDRTPARIARMARAPPARAGRGAPWRAQRRNPVGAGLFRDGRGPPGAAEGCVRNGSEIVIVFSDV